MKKIVATLIMLIALSVIANDPKVFTGRYKSSYSSDCDMESGSRVYISQGKPVTKSSTIIIQSYKEDARFSEVPTENRRAQIQSSPENTYTEITKVKWLSPTSLKVSISVQGKNYGKKLDYTQEHALLMSGKKLTYSTTLDGRSESRCDLVKY